MRGEQVIFKNTDINDCEAKQIKKGRNSSLLKERNRALIYRYYYYKNNSSLRYEAIIMKLRVEFYLSEITIVEIITSNVEVLLEVQKSNPSVSLLKKQFQHFNWV